MHNWSGSEGVKAFFIEHPFIPDVLSRSKTCEKLHSEKREFVQSEQRLPDFKQHSEIAKLCDCSRWEMTKTIILNARLEFHVIRLRVIVVLEKKHFPS